MTQRLHPAAAAAAKVGEKCTLSFPLAAASLLPQSRCCHKALAAALWQRLPQLLLLRRESLLVLLLLQLRLLLQATRCLHPLQQQQQQQKLPQCAVYVNPEHASRARRSHSSSSNTSVNSRRNSSSISSNSTSSSRMRRQLADAKARLRTHMLAVRCQHLLMQQLQRQQLEQQQQHQQRGQQQQQQQQKQQVEQQKVAECLALQHLDKQLDKLLRVLGSVFPGRLRDAQGDTEAAAATSAAAAGAAARPLRVGGYYSIGSEYCCLPLLERLWSLGAEVSLPVCPSKGRLLQFRLYHPKEPLLPGKFGIPCPREDRLHPQVHPEVLFVPLLAFDGTGRRLGYGGGFYDATIAALRAAAAPAAAAAAAAAAPAAAVRTAAELLGRLKSTGSLNVPTADTAEAAASQAREGQTSAAPAAPAAKATAAADKILSKPLLCGVGFACQEVAEGTLPLELHDELLDLVLAEEQVRIFNPKLATILQ
ncbi:hypothetical protein ACSSS7_000987 [Eimeria intestinalis]